MGERKETGLVMEGGAMRGMFTCGVIDVFMENSITFDGAVGVSAGAAFGCNIKSKQIGRPIRYNKRFCNDKRYASLRSWIKTGDLFNAEFCYGTLVKELDIWDDKTFAKNPMNFYVVATDIVTGEPVYHKCLNGLDADLLWIRASASIPIASKPVEIAGGLYLDGGIADSIPLKFMESEGYKKIVVIETQPKDYVKKPQKAMPVVRAWLRKYPQMAKTMENRYLMYNAQKAYVRKQEDNQNVFVIRPQKPLNIGATTKNPDELERVYQEGRLAASMVLNQVKEYLGI